jgi:hypothetical protein
MTDIAEALVTAGDAEAARNVASDAVAEAEKITNDDRKSAALSKLAAVLAQAHSYRDARLTADLCSLSPDRITAYAAILREYTIQQHPDRAKLFQQR